MQLNITKEWFQSRAHFEDGHDVHACGCIGPQNGQPVCPCRMRGVTVVDGRYVEINDLGPVPTGRQRDPRATLLRLAAKSLEPKL